MPVLRPILAVALAAASALLLAGCASAGAGEDDGRVSVVASTSVYGQIAEAIGGEHVDVASIVSSTSQDPHSFEPSAQDQLAVRKADLVIENGAGYDAFIDALIEASGSTAPVLTAVEFSQQWPGGSATESGGDHDHADDHIEGFNEHVWYDVETMGALAKGIQSQLEALDPAHAEDFAANLADFMQGISDRETELTEIESAHAGTEIFVTEPVPLYLTGAAGLVNVAPDDFTEAVEEGQDVAPATLLEALKLLRSGDVRVVIVNAQTGGAETSQVIQEAETASIPVLEFAEILPEGQTYLSWMQANIEALTGALDPVTAPPLQITGAALRRGDRELWSGLDLTVASGELVAVLGPSGSGKTTLLRAILGLEPLSAGTIRTLGDEVRTRGSRRIGYIPQQRPLPPETALRGRDLVALGVDGHRFGLPFPRRGERERVDRLIDAVGARDFADDPVGLLSGGEQQRLRVGQALADDPRLLLCDEPLTSLDLANQQAVVGIIDRHRRETGAAVLLVTHDINPVLGQVDRILYLANGRFMLGRPDEVLDSKVLSDLYGAPVFVLRAGNRLVVVGAPDAEESHHHHEHDEAQG